MRYLAVSIFAVCLFLPASAFAGSYYSHSYAPPCAQNTGSMTASCQNGVTVYRAKPMRVNQAALHRVYKAKEAKAHSQKLKAKLRKQNRKLKAQAEAIESLKTRIATLEEPPRRGRYDRVYYGNPRFFGRNGFVGNRNFLGGSVRIRRGHRGYSKRH